MRAKINSTLEVAGGDEPGSVVPLLRIHVLSARGLPRSSGAVGMPDTYVIVKFNGEKVGATKADRKTRRPEWNQNFTVRWDLVEPDPPPDDEDDDISMMMCHDPGRSSCSAAVAKAAARAHLSASGGEAKTDPNGASCRCNKCRRRGIELELEVWHQYDREDVGREDAKSSSPAGNEPKRPSSPSNSGSSGAGGGARQPNTEANRGGGGLNGLGKAGGGELVRRSSKPDTLYDDRLFDVSYVSRCLQRGALRRVHTVVSGRNKLIGISRISSTQLRALGASTLPADLAIKDPRGSWLWSRRGTIRVAVSLERLQANVIGASLLPGELPPGVSLGAGVGAGGVARVAAKEASGEDVPPAELSCKVLWNDQDFSNPSSWDKVFCITRSNNQLWLEVSHFEDQRLSPRLSPKKRTPPTDRGSNRKARPSVLPLGDSSKPRQPGTRETPPIRGGRGGMIDRGDSGDLGADRPAGRDGSSLDMCGEAGRKGLKSTPASDALIAPTRTASSSKGPGALASCYAPTAPSPPATSGTSRFAVSVASPPSPPGRPRHSALADLSVRDSGCTTPRSGIWTPRALTPEGGGPRGTDPDTWTPERRCILTLGRAYSLSTFDAQGLADMLNSGDDAIERMAGTKEWHQMGFRLHWDSVHGRFTILNVSRKRFILRGGCSSLATELLGFGVEDYESSPVPEAVLDPQHPSDPPRRYMGVVGSWLPPPLSRPTWMRIMWGPPAVEIAKGGKLQVQLWARQPSGSLSKAPARKRRRRSGIARSGQADDGSWLLGTALLEMAEVCGIATGSPTKLPLFSPMALRKYERLTSASVVATSKAGESVPSSLETEFPSPLLRGIVAWTINTPAAILARQRQKLRRWKRRVAAQGVVDRCIPVGAGGAFVWWGFHPRCRRPGLVRRGLESSVLALPSLGTHPPEATPTAPDYPGQEQIDGTSANGHDTAAGPMAVGRLFAKGDTLQGSPDSRAMEASSIREGVVGHVWVALKLRDPSMMMMRAVRTWNMARDEASEEQRRKAQAEANRLWMFMPGISLWRVLIQLMGISLLVSYCVTLTLRAYHSTRCRATFGCEEGEDTTLASLREWQTLVDNILSALSFLDMLLQFRTAYVDNKSRIITSPKKVALHYLKTWFLTDLLCSLPYSTMQPLLRPLFDEVEGAVDSFAILSAEQTASRELSESLSKGVDSPLSLWVFKLSKRLHIGRINRIRGTRAFNYLDDFAMGIHFTVKQVVDVVRGRRKVMVWMGNPPKKRGRLGNIFSRIRIANRWTHIVLSYRLLGYAKVIGTLVRAMRVLAVAIRAVPQAARVLRLLAVFLRSYEGRRRSKDLHEASIVIQRRAGQHMAMKVARRMQAKLRRKARAVSESAIAEISSTSGALDAISDPSRDGRPPELAASPAISIGAPAAAAAAMAARGELSPVERSYRRRRESSSTLSLPLSRSDCGLSDCSPGTNVDAADSVAVNVAKGSLLPRDGKSSSGLEPEDWSPCDLRNAVSDAPDGQDCWSISRVRVTSGLCRDMKDKAVSGLAADDGELEATAQGVNVLSPVPCSKTSALNFFASLARGSLAPGREASGSGQQDAGAATEAEAALAVTEDGSVYDMEVAGEDDGVLAASVVVPEVPSSSGDREDALHRLESSFSRLNVNNGTRFNSAMTPGGCETPEQGSE